MSESEILYAGVLCFGLAVVGLLLKLLGMKGQINE